MYHRIVDYASKGGRQEKIFIKIRTSDLCDLFKCSPDTLRRWIRQGKIDPYSLRDVIEKSKDIKQLDGRRRPLKEKKNV